MITLSSARTAQVPVDAGLDIAALLWRSGLPDGAQTGDMARILSSTVAGPAAPTQFEGGGIAAPRFDYPGTATTAPAATALGTGPVFSHPVLQPGPMQWASGAALTGLDLLDRGMWPAEAATIAFPYSSPGNWGM